MAIVQSLDKLRETMLTERKALEYQYRRHRKKVADDAEKLQKVDAWYEAYENVLVREYDVTRMETEASRCKAEDEAEAKRAKYYLETVDRLTAELPGWRKKLLELADELQGIVS